MSMEKRRFGKSDLEVSILGYGAGHIGDASLDEDFVGSLLNQIVDNGITLIDTARGYNLSEERIGRHLSYRRQDFVLSTKVGYGIDGYQDWTYDCIIAGVDYALKLMQTEYIDIVHLHSCPKEILERGEVLDALDKTKKDGKVRVTAYSGENEDLDYAINSSRFGSIQTSVNLCDQRGISEYVKIAADNGMGVIAKRPIANAPWRFDTQPVGNYAEEYWKRLQKMNIDTRGLDWNELALRFTAFTPGVSSCIVGSTNIDHILANIDAVNKGALHKAHYASIQKAFRDNDDNWTGQV